VVAAAVETTFATKIAGLPDDLCYVPPSPNGPHDPEGDAKRAEWRDWQFRMRKYRMKRIQEMKDRPEKRVLERRRCAMSPAYFMAVWATIYEPRHEPKFGIIGGTKPWIPFAIQVEFVQWLDARMESGDVDRDGIVSKCRDMGATWTVCCWLVHGWLFKHPWNVLLMSRNQSLVDSKSDDSMFSKIDMVLNGLPDWMLPEGFSLKNKQYNSELILINPATKTQIKGESTNSNAGRSGRYTVIVVDEAAFVENFSPIWAGLGATTYHRIAVSSESLRLGPDFYNLGIGNKNPDHRRPALFTMDWWDHPIHDLAWLNAEKDRYEANNQLDDFYQEYLRDARAGNTAWVYPQAMDLVVDNAVHFVDMGILYASIDPGFRDQTAIVWIQEQNGKYALIGAYENRGKPAEFYTTIIKGEPDFDAGWNYTHSDIEFMEWTSTLPRGYLTNGAFYGDVSGHNITGATMDSFYSILSRHGIHVNKDRQSESDTVGFRREARTHKGRQEAVREILPSFVIAADHNAPYALRRLQENQYPAESGKAMTESKAAKHDDSSHITTAIEYFAVHRKLAHSLIAVSAWRAARRKKQNERDLSPLNPKFRDYGRHTRLPGTR
jgi:hypothetical protein